LPEALYPQAINFLGHWAGYRHRCDAEVISDVFGRLALKWTPEAGVQQLPLPPQTHDARALGINDSGVVVGWRAGESVIGSDLGYWGCVWSPQGLVEIPHHEPWGNSSFAYAINNSGVVVGYRDTEEAPVLRKGFIWSEGTIVDIDPAPFGSTRSAARDISDIGFVVGFLGSEATANTKAFIWRDGITQLLAPVEGAVASRAYGVNDLGQAVGSCRIPQAEDPGFTNQPTVWDADGTPRLLSILPPYTGATLHSINNGGVVLGVMSMPPTPGYDYLRYAVWIDDMPYWVSDLADSPNASSFGGVNVDLNQRGQLVVEGPSSIYFGAWILKPQSSAADLNGDCRVDGLDLAALLGTWGPCSPAEHADFDRSGSVDGADLGALLGAWSVE
jgi:probable HAF family extracellular repeat protein